MKVSLEDGIAFVTIEKGDYERYGSYTLIGTMMKNLNLMEVRVVQLMFRVRSTIECEKEGGPDEIIMPEYVPLCLIEDILELQNRGWAVTFYYIDSNDILIGR